MTEDITSRSIDWLAPWHGGLKAAHASAKINLIRRNFFDNLLRQITY